MCHLCGSKTTFSKEGPLAGEGAGGWGRLERQQHQVHGSFPGRVGRQGLPAVWVAPGRFGAGDPGLAVGSAGREGEWQQREAETWFGCLSAGT